MTQFRGNPNLLELWFEPFSLEISSLLQNVPSNALQETRRGTEALVATEMMCAWALGPAHRLTPFEICWRADFCPLVVR